jgi:sugar phosphate isomerase/epimerase
MIGMSSSWLATKGYNIKSSVEKIFSLGFDLVELGAAHKYEPRAMEIAKLLKKDHPNKKFTVHTLFPPLEDFYLFNIADSKNFEKNVRILKMLFQVSKDVGAEVVSIHGGYKKVLKRGEEYFGFYKLEFVKNIEESEGRRTIERLIETGIGIAEKSGIKLCVETDAAGLENAYTAKPEDFQWLLSKFDSKYFGMLADIGHIHIAAQKFGFDEYEFVRSFKDRIFEMHLHDCNSKGDSHIPTGTGVMDFEKYFRAVGQRARKIPLIFEYTNRVSIADAVRSKKFIEKILKKV